MPFLTGVPAARTVTFAPTAQADVFDLRVEGPSTGPGLVPAGPDLIEVGVEQRAPGTSDELGGAPAASPEIRVQATSALKAGAPLTLPVPPLWEGTVRLRISDPPASCVSSSESTST